MEYSDCIYESVRSLSILEINSLYVCCKIFLNRHLFLLFENKFNVVIYVHYLHGFGTFCCTQEYFSLPPLPACLCVWGGGEREREWGPERGTENLELIVTQM